MPEWRRDPVTGRWVIISTERANRPGQSTADNPSDEACPFCPGNEAMTPPEVLAYRHPSTAADRSGWTVRVVPNKYPAVIDTEIWAGDSNDFYRAASGSGIHEVIIETPDHVANAAALATAQLASVLRAYRDRMSALSAEKRWRAILIFKNQGHRAGATLEHCHSQLMALAEIPQTLSAELTAARAYVAATGRCLYCDLGRRELADRKRCIVESEHFVCFCPYAARFAYETWILPKFHSPFFERMPDAAYAELAGCLKDTLSRLERVLPATQLNYVLHSSLPDSGPADYYDWHLEILPRTAQLAGFELGSGSYINTLAPEEAAQRLRDLGG